MKARSLPSHTAKTPPILHSSKRTTPAATLSKLSSVEQAPQSPPETQPSQIRSFPVQNPNPLFPLCRHLQTLPRTFPSQAEAELCSFPPFSHYSSSFFHTSPSIAPATKNRAPAAYKLLPSFLQTSKHTRPRNPTPLHLLFHPTSAAIPQQNRLLQPTFQAKSTIAIKPNSTPHSHC